MYPHTPDNSFLGFAMEMPEQVYNGKKKEIALIYGKKGYMFGLSIISQYNFIYNISYFNIEKYMYGKTSYLASIGTKLQLHSTFKTYFHKLQGTDIINHGIVNHTILARFSVSSLFIP